MYLDPIKKCQNDDYRSNGSILSSSRNIDTFARLGGTIETRNFVLLNNKIYLIIFC